MASNINAHLVYGILLPSRNDAAADTKLLNKIENLERARKLFPGIFFKFETAQNDDLNEGNIAFFRVITTRYNKKKVIRPNDLNTTEEDDAALLAVAEYYGIIANPKWYLISSYSDTF